MKLQYIVSVPATSTAAITLPFVEELGGIPDPDYFTGGATSE